MKHSLLFFAFVLFSQFSFLNQTQNLPHCQAGKNNYIANESNSAPEPQVSSSLFKHLNKDLIKKDSKDIDIKGPNLSLYTKAIENIKGDEYNISFCESSKSYQSPNRANNIRFIFHNDGFTAKLRENKIPLFDLNDKTVKEEDKKYKEIEEWSIKLKIQDVRREMRDDNEKLLTPSCELQKFNGREIRIDKNKASIEDNNMKVDYTNDEKGMRQDFIIKNKPDGEGKLKLELSAETNLKMISKADGLIFKDKTGSEKMNYSALKVWDANGKVLQAKFEDNYLPCRQAGELHALPSVRQITNYKLKETHLSGINPNSEIPRPKSFAIVVNDEDAVYPITIDLLSTSPDWTGEGNQANAAYGFSVSTAGDVNGDGFSDVIIGAPFYDNGETNEGRAFVYLGSIIGLLPEALWTGEGNQTNAQFGYSVSTAGDVNDDGYSDVIIGANVYDNDQIDEGRVFVYFGSISGPSFTANWIAESNQSGSQYGWSVSTAGDVNDDGYSDIIVGAPLYDNQQSNEGGAFIYYGSLLGLPALPSRIVESNQATAYFGISVSTAGDVNGDGYSDVIVGANVYDNPLTDEGAAFIYYGSSAGIPSTANWTSESHQLAFFAYYGISVSTAGDVNGDGYSDVIVGAYSFDNGETDEGKVFVYHGSPTGLPSTANWTAESNQAYANFGNSVSSAGDLNGDGYSDVIVGASTYDSGEINEGKVFVYYGSPAGLSPVANWTAESNQENAYFGVSVSTAERVNGDLYSDVIVGAYLYDNGQSEEGNAFVYHGGVGGSKILTLTMFVQGFYNPSTNTMRRDTVRVYLRNTSSPYTIVDSSKAYLSSSGIGIFSFANVSSGVNYYIQVKHRNSIETWSATGQNFTTNFLNYDFSTLSTQAYGNNMIQIDITPVRFAVYSGDVNQDGIIDASDLSLVDNSAFNSSSGYIRTDVNGDNFVDASDLSIADNNVYNGITKITPN